MAKNLLIVESPAKAKTIEKFLGSDFSVVASYGHIRDLPKNSNAVDIEDNFRPIYEVSPEKKDVVSRLRSLSKQAEEVWLATDEDREGEAISWHIAEVLNLDLNTTKRIVFHEITKSAIQTAVKNPRIVNIDLVNAQQARRVLDRLVGYELSAVLWKKVKFGLAAGRVQSVAVKLIVEREKEIKLFATKFFYKIKADFQTSKNEKFKAEVLSKIENEIGATDYLQKCIQAKFRVDRLEKKPGTRRPSAPFTTSTLQQEASRKLSMGVARTMRVAQSLYENGHITYMRTDSVNLSETALQAARESILTHFGERYHKQRIYTGKVANAQEAHEAIRPTNFEARKVSEDAAEQRLYELIWKRTLASQMADAELEKTVIDIEALPVNTEEKLQKLIATGEVIKFDGFLKLYIEGKDDDHADDDPDQSLLPNLSVGDFVDLIQMTATQSFTKPSARYTEASLVKKMEELGIGRPSTYAPTIQKIIDRNYVEKTDKEGTQRNYNQYVLKENKITQKLLSETVGTEKQKLFPTDLGILVTDFLVKNFNDVVEYSFTAGVEEIFDEIAHGKVFWVEMLRDFYGPFHNLVEQVEKDAPRLDGERYIGIDPASGKPVSVRLGKYGPLAQIGDRDDASKTFASLRPNQRIDTIQLEEALELFKLPRLVGQFEDADIKASIGRFGPYLLHNSKFISLPKELDPYSVTESEAIEVIQNKRESNEAKILKRFPGKDYVISKGRWGKAVLLANGLNISLPKELTVENINESDCDILIEKHSPSKTKSGKSTKSAKKIITEKSEDPVKSEKKSGKKDPGLSSKSTTKTTQSNTDHGEISKNISKSLEKNSDTAPKGLIRKPKTK